MPQSGMFNPPPVFSVLVRTLVMAEALEPEAGQKGETVHDCCTYCFLVTGVPTALFVKELLLEVERWRWSIVRTESQHGFLHLAFPTEQAEASYQDQAT